MRKYLLTRRHNAFDPIVAFGGALTNLLLPESVTTVDNTHATGWDDLGPNAYDWAAVMGAPLIVPSLFGGRGGVRFDGVGDSIEGPASNLVFPNNAFVVWMAVRQLGDGGTDNTGAGYFHNPPYIADNGNSCMVGQKTITGVDSAEIGLRATPSTTRNSVGMNNPRTPMKLHAALNGVSGVATIRVNNGTAQAFLMDDGLDFPGMTTLSIARSASGGFLNCEIGCICIVNRDATSAEDLGMDSFLLREFGV